MPLDATDPDKIASHYLRAAGIEPTAGVSVINNPKLKLALETAINCESLIAGEQERLQKMLENAQSDVEIKAREYQIWYVEQYLKRAASIARERLDYFQNLTDIEVELEKCKDPHHWFKYYAWGYDPRARAPISVVPFDLFPRQAELVTWLDTKVFEHRASGIIEKARDEGATEICVRWGVHRWRFKDGFSMLLSTRTEDEVDTKKKQGTLFERARFQIRLLPLWMLPKKFDIEKDLLPDKLISNPGNGNAMHGQAPVENMGRGDRVTVAVFDEFAFWRFAGYPQFRSMSQTTDSIIMPSSVAGKLNQYADIAFDGVTDKFVMDWRDNPFKTQAWYDALPYGYISPKMSRTTIAQEVDRNYEAAQPGKVWQCREEFTFITISEFLKPFETAGFLHKFYDEAGKFKIPNDWRWVRTHDYGKSDGHDWGFLIGAQPRAAYPLADTHFIFVARNLEPTGLLTAQAVEQWRGFEQSLGLRSKQDWINKPSASWHSHEQKSLRKVLLEEYGENWEAWDTDYQEGIEQIESWFEPIDLLNQNPFRPQLYGRTKVVFVAPDGEYSLAFNDRLRTHFVTVSQTETGFLTCRKQISAYHYPMTELGKAKKDMRPEKDFDDIVDCFRGYAVNWNRQPASLTYHEKVEAAAENVVKMADIEKAFENNAVDASMMMTARMQAEKRLRDSIREEDKPAEAPWAMIG